ncbi:unnamed protein product, partial [Phaeothamnion confervicola]
MPAVCGIWNNIFCRGGGGSSSGGGDSSSGGGGSSSGSGGGDASGSGGGGGSSRGGGDSRGGGSFSGQNGRAGSNTPASNASATASPAPAPGAAAMAPTNLIVPELRLTPVATQYDLRAIAIPQGTVLYHDHTVPSLEPSFLYHFRQASTQARSAKLAAMRADLQEVSAAEPGAKFVVFSQFQGVLDAAAAALRLDGIGHVTIGGSADARRRQNAVVSFSTDRAVRAILLTTGAAAAGLTLTAAHVLYMLDPSPSAADEAQSLARAHRIGQTQAVRCVIFYMRNSVEERLLALRNDSGDGGASSGGGAGSGGGSGSGGGTAGGGASSGDGGASSGGGAGSGGGGGGGGRRGGGRRRGYGGRGRGARRRRGGDA